MNRLHLIKAALKMQSQRAKLTADGVWQWVISAGGTGNSISVDGNGYAYITGSFWGTTMFGNTTVTGPGYTEFFEAKLDSSGN